MTLLSEGEYYYKLDNIVLSSLEFLRQVFKNKWKAETGGDDWIDDEEHVKKFIERMGRNAYKKLPFFQKTTLKDNGVAEWDMSLLSVVIQNFGCEKKYEKENVALRQLKNIRNDLAHNGSNKVSQEEYLQNVEKFKTSLQTLGMDEKSIEKIIEKAGVTSSLKALEYINTLHAKADQFLKNGQTQNAVDCLSEAIKVPSLLPVNLGTAYEKRAECYLSQVKDPLVDLDKCKCALLDTIKAIELNEYSWVAHYLAAQCYRWKNELSQAIVHYEKALAVSPAQEKVKAEYDSCKVLAGIQSRCDHLNPRMMPMNLEERVAHLEHETGIEMSKENFLKMNVMAGEMIKGQDHVARGHQHFYGWNVPKNFTEAAKHYSKATKLKNPEGMYNLAQCYHHGNGVKQDVQEALRMYREVAEMDGKTPGQTTPLKCNVGVASAQHVLGMFYNDGIAVERDYILAAYWYKKAMENGIANAANNLGILYFNGQGMPQDEKQAELCWKQAVILKDPNAPASLINYYMNHREPEKALNMLRIGRELGNSGLLNVSDVEFNRHITQIKSDRFSLEPEVIAFEKINNLDGKGLTFRERLSRKDRFTNPKLEKLEKVLQETKGEKKSWGGKIQQLSIQHFFNIHEKALQGSQTACKILETITLSFELNDLVDAYFERDDELAFKIISILYKIVTLEFHMHRVLNHSKLKCIVGKFFDKKCDSVGNEDMKTRLCYVALNLGRSIQSEDTYSVEILKEGIRRYPTNVYYYDYLINNFGNKSKFEEGRDYAEKSLKLFPDNVELLYLYAVFLRQEGSPRYTDSERIKAYKKFLSVAPTDHRKVPDAFYQLSFVIMSQHLQENSVSHRQDKMSETLDQVKAYFQCGQEAEKSQLPCYLPYGESQCKVMVETFLTVTETIPSPKTVTCGEDEQVKEVRNKMSYLMSPTRKGVIQIHRQLLKDAQKMIEQRKKMGMSTALTTATPKLKQTLVKRMSMVSAITLQEMNPTEDQIYQNRVLELTIMDELNALFSSLHLIAEDENGDMTRLYVYNVERDNATLVNFRPGCRVAILNPYMRIGVDTTNAIRVDEPKCLIFLEKVENMCRFCGEANASSKCSQCKRPYCSKECQKLDWKELNHKLICLIKC